MFWAAFLQCVPLLGAAGCFINGANDQNSLGTALLLWVSILFWGLGYLYVGAFGRLALAVLAGPVLAYAACTVSFSSSTYDYMHANGEHDPADVRSANRASIQTGIILTLAVAALAADAARAASAHNTRLRDAIAIEPPVAVENRPSVVGCLERRPARRITAWGDCALRSEILGRAKPPRMHQRQAKSAASESGSGPKNDRVLPFTTRAEPSNST